MAELDHDMPINVIILEDIEHKRECSIDDYLDILKSCRKAEEFRSLIQMIIDETRVLTLREILIKRIQNDAKVLEETLNNR